ncbi:MAG: META domain-containing protein [Flavobacteriales bacterium]|nr:META domain-containing protein [Flavobacteriales bacterium]NNK79961.1 META domain-containing protein [Flavobacteriales bacterium]
MNKDLQGRKTGKRMDLWLNSHRPDIKGDYYLAKFSQEEALAWDTIQCKFENFDYIPGSLYHLEVREIKDDSNLRTYVVTEMKDQVVDPILKIHDIYVLREMPEFNSETNRISRATIEINTNTREILGQAHCNRYSAQILELDDSKISFSPIAQTKMACPDLGSEQEYTERLIKTTAYQREGLELRFLDSSGQIVLVFKKVD